MDTSNDPHDRDWLPPKDDSAGRGLPAKLPQGRSLHIIDVGNIPAAEAEALVASYRAKHFRPLTPMEDLFIPVTH